MSSLFGSPEAPGYSSAGADRSLEWHADDLRYYHATPPEQDVENVGTAALGCPAGQSPASAPCFIIRASCPRQPHRPPSPASCASSTTSRSAGDRWLASAGSSSWTTGCSAGAHSAPYSASSSAALRCSPSDGSTANLSPPCQTPPAKS